MTRDETIKILAILKAAYPNSYKNMSKDEANATATVWAVQFADIPAEVVMIAINKLIGTSPFPPAISEVKDRIEGLYWEICVELCRNKEFKVLTDEQETKYRWLLDVIEPFRHQSRIEPSIKELVGETNTVGYRFEKLSDGF